MCSHLKVKPNQCVCYKIVIIYTFVFLDFLVILEYTENTVKSFIHKNKKC